MGLEASLTGFNDWSFGQVAAVVLLAAPLITIIEYFKDGESNLVIIIQNQLGGLIRAEKMRPPHKMRPARIMRNNLSPATNPKHLNLL